MVMPLYLRVTTAADPRVSKDLFFTAMVFFSLIVFGFKREVPLFLKTIFLFISLASFFNQYDQYSFLVILQWLFFNAGLLLILQSISLLEEKHVPVIFNCLAISCVIQSVWILANYFNLDPYLEFFRVGGFKIARLDPTTLKVPVGKLTTAIVGSLSNRDLSAWFISMTLPALLRGKWIYLAPLAITAIILCKCTGAGVAAISIFAIFFLGKYYETKKVLRIFLLSFLGFCALVFFVPTNFFPDNERFKLWLAAFKWIKGFELWGIGLGGFRDKFLIENPGIVVQKFKQLHNEYMELYLAFGSVGIALLLGLIHHLWWKTKTKLTLTLPLLMLISTAVNCTVGFPLHISSTALIFIVAFSLFYTNEGKQYGVFIN